MTGGVSNRSLSTMQRQGSGGCVSPGSGIQTTPDTAGKENDIIPVVFTWTHGGQRVFLAGSFNGWQEKIPMVRSGLEFCTVQEVPRGKHQYKFIVDDQWRTAQDQMQTHDDNGNVNNVLDITNYQVYQPDPLDQPEDYNDLAFGQHIPDPNDYTSDAPTIPLLLAKSPFLAATQLPILCGASMVQPPNIPLQSMSDHVFLQSDPSSERLSVAVTHRYDQTYSTMIYITRKPSGPPQPNAGGARETCRRVNPLKKAVIRRPQK